MVRFACLLLLTVPAAANASSCDAMLRDPARSRSIPVRLTVPDDAQAPVPLIVWSPGLGGGLAQGGLYAQAWAKAGLATLQFAHPGSDAQVYQEAEARARAAATPEAARAARAARIREAVSADQLAARIADVRFAVSQLPFGFGPCRTDQLDQSRLGIGGHSMGAWVAQYFAGQQLSAELQPRSPFKAAIAVAGSPLLPAEARAAAVTGITRPFFLVTGTRDGIAANAEPEAARAQLAERMGLWPYLPAGGKYLFVAKGATHMQLAGTNAREVPPALAERLLPILTDFWLHTLRDAPPPTTPNLAEGDVFEAR